MNKQILLISVGVLILAGPAMAQERAVTMAVAEPSEPVESVIPELAGIVVLCAKDDPAEFEKAWRAYLADNDLKGKELQNTIRNIVDQADTLRANQKFAAGELVSVNNNFRAERKQLMTEVAQGRSKARY